MSAPFGRNERLLVERLSGLSKRERVKFSAACAQRLVTAIDRVPRLKEPHGELAEALRVLFELAEGGDFTDLPQSAIDGAESYVVDEDDPAWVPSDAVLENAVAAVAYAYDAARSDEVSAAVWAARQLDEAADFVDETIANGPFATLVDGPMRALALTWIDVTVDAVVDWSVRDIQSASVADGLRLREAAVRAGVL